MNNNIGIITGANEIYWPCVGALAIGAYRNGIKFAVADHGFNDWQKEELKRIGTLFIEHEKITLPKNNSNLAANAWYKPFICKSSPFNKSIWIDSDAIIINDIKDIFKYDLGVGKKVLWNRSGYKRQPVDIARILFGNSVNNKILLDVKYINTGVIVFSRNNSFIDEWVEMTKKILYNTQYADLCKAKDQDTFILTCIQRAIGNKDMPIILNDNYNYPADGLKNGKYHNRKHVSNDPNELIDQLKLRHKKNVKIVHYVGNPKPWEIIESGIDILIPLGTGSKYCDIETKILLRSIDKYITGYRKIIIIGPKIPEFINECNKLLFIKRDEDKCNRYARVQKKIEWVLNNVDITNKFVLFNDDFIVLKKTDIRTISYGVGGSLPLSKQNSGWMEYKRRTAELLLSKGMSIRNYDLHIPMILERSNYLKICHEWNKGIILMRSFYGNVFCDKGNIITRDVKLQSEWKKKIYKIIKKNKRWVISYGDGALNNEFGEYMLTMFPDKSRFEK